MLCGPILHAFRRAPRMAVGPRDLPSDHLKIAGKHEPGLNLRLLCSEAHLGAEKAVKGVMIARGEVFPYTHDIGLLLDRAAGISRASSSHGATVVRRPHAQASLDVVVEVANRDARHPPRPPFVRGA